MRVGSEEERIDDGHQLHFYLERGWGVRAKISCPHEDEGKPTECGADQGICSLKNELAELGSSEFLEYAFAKLPADEEFPINGPMPFVWWGYWSDDEAEIYILPKSA